MQFALEDVCLCPFNCSIEERMQLVYEVILVNKIVRNHLLSENMQLDYSIWVWPE